LSEVLQPTEPGETRGIELYEAALKGKTTRRELHRAGRNYEHLIVPVSEGRHIVAGLALLYDVSERKEKQRALQDVLETLAQTAELLRQASITDQLTGLRNRRGFMVLAEQAMLVARRNAKSATIFFFDLNGMKPINDQLGHEMGDRALVETAVVLRASFRASDILCRLGGDEFVVLATESGRAAVPELEQRIAKYVEEFNAKKSVPFELSLSVGAVVWEPGDDASLETLLAKADALMYDVKRNRKGAGHAVAR
jgi:diguanylate cyclase (GGDEF)-like protein